MIAEDLPLTRRSGNRLDVEVFGTSAGTMNASDSHTLTSRSFHRLEHERRNEAEHDERSRGCSEQSALPHYI